MAPKKEKAPPPSSKPAKSGGGGKQKKKKWSKGKQKEKVNNAVLFDQATYDKMLSEVPKYKQITPSLLSERLRMSVKRMYHAVLDQRLFGTKSNQGPDGKGINQDGVCTCITADLYEVHEHLKPELHVHRLFGTLG
ncbi:hypothetical protein Taro_005373 [Colocasia esculenta]|uniref:40S ribosomal protein S25 n=1 Tax=Colocasia esculenta TaxID=4460 RepID=A0A843TMW2_COLES|nr:hypothetical protein [Colocasia esculenta]